MIEEAQLDEHQPEQKQKQPEQQIELKSFNHISLYYTYLQRYYTTYESNHEYVHFHSNGLFIIRPKLAALPSKPVEIQGLLEPVEVKGKKKRGGVRVKPNTHIAKIKCQNGDIIKIVACVEGTVIEHNTNVKAEDLQKDESYLVIVLPSRRFVPEQNGMKKVTYHGNPLSLT